MTRSAPYSVICRILAGEAMLGTKIFAGMPSFIAAKATAAPWFPPDAATTPARGTALLIKWVNAPRTLNGPAVCRDSSLRPMLPEFNPKSSPCTSITGVRRMCPAMRSYAARICSSENMLHICRERRSFPVDMNIVDWQTNYMIELRALQALGNERRLQILEWLKDPPAHFRPQVDGDLIKDGVCAALIAEKLDISQPTLSEHMRVLCQAGLVRSKRIKQWTFYKRDEGRIKELKRAIAKDL